MKNNKEKLHLGCGLHAPDSWLNLDGSWNARLAKHDNLRKILGKLGIVPESQVNIEWSSDIFIHNVRKPLPFDDNLFSAVYSSHLLEHLYFEEAQNLLTECFRVVRPGGVVRMMVPDLETFSRDYLEDKKKGSGAEPAGDKFIDKLKLSRKKPHGGSLPYKIYSLATDFHSHKWMYDDESLIFHFKNAGFSNVRAMDRHESKIEGIEEVEKREGLCVEGIKPDNK